MESCCSQLLELDHGGFTAMHPFGGHGSYQAFKEVRGACQGVTQVNVPSFWGGVLCAQTLSVYTHTSILLLHCLSIHTHTHISSTSINSTHDGNSTCHCVRC